jgi:RNA polymerase sigma-70 factor (ECF subfamily)
MYAFCRKYISDHELARDIVQDAFVKLLENYDAVKTSVSAYLFASVHNGCISHIRRQKLKAEHEEYVALQIKEYEIHPDGVPEHLQQLYHNELKQQYDESVERLPDKCRHIFRLSRSDNMSNKEIAEKLGISIRTVESQIYNALKRLKEDLKDFF